VGPRLLYPDGRLQEAGAFIDEDGVAVQVGKFSIYDKNDLSKYRVVDYCSAACFAVRRGTFDCVAGFDHIYEPLYYEDVDLCFKITSLGKHIYYCPESAVYHIENATSSEQRVKLSLNNIVELNKATFLSRWGDGFLRDLPIGINLTFENCPCQPMRQRA
jgi:GT2 family glycosyltransferase